MNEIDMYRGILRKMENDRRYARISILLSFRNQTIPDSRPSRFDWINTVDFYSYMQQNILTRQTGFSGPFISLPEGFALVDNSPVYRAVSPEGVRFRVKRFDNYPEKSGEFWQEALFSYLRGKGYLEMTESSVPPGEKSGDKSGATSVPHKKIKLGGEAFVSFVWGVPYGNEDYIYMTGLRVVKRKLNCSKLPVRQLLLESTFKNDILFLHPSAEGSLQRGFFSYRSRQSYPGRSLDLPSHSPL